MSFVIAPDRSAWPKNAYIKTPEALPRGGDRETRNHKTNVVPAKIGGGKCCRSWSTIRNLLTYDPLFSSLIITVGHLWRSYDENMMVKSLPSLMNYNDNFSKITITFYDDIGSSSSYPLWQFNIVTSALARPHQILHGQSYVAKNQLDLIW
jgi:hypothetical protein